MKKVKIVVTNDFKNSRSVKHFNASLFVAKYNKTEKNEENYKIFIDREDDRRIILKLSLVEANELLDALSKSLK